MRTKTTEVLCQSKILEFDFYILCETWLHDGVSSLELFDESYTVFRKDRYSSQTSSIPKGGGVLIAVKNKFDTTRIELNESSDLEVIATKTKLYNKNLFIFCVYIPPNAPVVSYSNLISVIEIIRLNTSYDDEIIVCGDFNLPNLKWERHESEPFFTVNSTFSASESILIDGIKTNNLEQISHIINFQNRQLDLIFSSDWINFAIVNKGPVLSKLDKFHPPIIFTFSYNNLLSSLPDCSFNFNFTKTNFNELNNYFSSFSCMNTSSISNSDDLDAALDEFYEIVWEGFRLFVPLVRDRRASVPWMLPDLKKLKNKKNKAWNRYLSNGSAENYNVFISLYSEYKTKILYSYENYIYKVAYECKSNPKKFWKFVNSKRKTDQYPNYMTYNSETSNDPMIISEYFKKFFCSSYEIQSSSYAFQNSPEITLISDHNGQFPMTEITESLVRHYLEKLEDNTSSGPDNVPELILKRCSNFLACHLSFLFKNSLFLGYFPQLWKNAFVRPIHKKGLKNEVSNYRPIAKLSSIPKLFERILYDQLYEYCAAWLTPLQHGFMKKKSTITNLVETSSQLILSMEDGYQTDVIYTDLSKAFDVLPHCVIINKLSGLGLSSQMIKWIESYLCNRTYSVIFRSQVSSSYVANSGVPQGSHLGPLFFIISINDIVQHIRSSKILIYADDIKLFRVIKELSDAYLLQEDLYLFLEWCNNNGLILNINKCAVVSYTRNLRPILFDYTFEGITIQRVTSFKDLGVIFDQKLSFELHLNSIINKANSTLGFVKRFSKEFRDPYVIKSLYSTLVRPHLEYASQIWSPFYSSHISRIESIQKNFLRFALRHLPWNNHLILPPYRDRLKLIDLKTLEFRRTVADIFFIIQVKNNCIISDYTRAKIDSLINTRNRFRSENIFRTMSHRTNYGKHEPINRMMSAINQYKNVIDLSFNRVELTEALSRLFG